MDNELLELRFASDPSCLKDVRRMLKESVSEIAGTRKFVSDVAIAVSEACMNIITHGYKGQYDKEILLQVRNADGVLEVLLTDYAEPMEIDKVGHRHLEDIRPGGLGTFLMTELMDKCEYKHLRNGPGNTLRMTKKIRPI